MKATVIWLLKPTVYFVERDAMLGDFVVKVSKYDRTETGIQYVDYHQEVRNVNYADLYFTKFFAQREANKSIIPYPEDHVQLLKKFTKLGVKLTEEEKRYLLEDGEYSSTYEKYCGIQAVTRD